MVGRRTHLGAAGSAARSSVVGPACPVPSNWASRVPLSGRMCRFLLAGAATPEPDGNSGIIG